MALYHFSVKQVSRGKGQTVVNSAAYISGQKLYNDYYGQTHDYTKKSGVVFTESGKAEQQPVNQQEKKPEKKTSLLRKLDEKKKECAVRDAKQQAVKKKRNHEMSL